MDFGSLRMRSVWRLVPMRLTTALLLVPSVAAAGTVALVKDIWPGDESNADLLMAAGNIVYFQADDGVHGRELWRSDGTEAGTFMVVDALAGPKWANPEPIGERGVHL